jgi:hypothetical protein
MLNTQLRVLLFDSDLADPTLLDDLTERVEGLKFSTRIHGGFLKCTFTISLSLADSWLYIAENAKVAGRHFCRVVIYEEQRVIWEGRLMDIALSLQSTGTGGGFSGVKITALGYWSSLKDQFYSDDDAGRTDWTSGSHTTDDIIKEMLTEECPSINSDQSNITANSRDVAGINLSSREYPQDIIVKKLAPLSDSDNGIWQFAIWENRIPYWSPRNLTTLDYRIKLSDTGGIQLKQSAMELRNAVTPSVGGTEGTTVTDAISLTFYPRREFLFDLPTGANANSQGDASSTLSTERSNPVQTSSFAISGHVMSALAGETGSGLIEVPKWRIRAGQYIRIDDLVPASISSPTLDRLRTFQIMETDYDVESDTIIIQPDSLPRSLNSILYDLGALESAR